VAGFGSIVIDPKLKYFPRCSTGSPLHSRFMISIDSLVRPPRSLTGIPHASYSAGNSLPTPIIENEMPRAHQAIYARGHLSDRDRMA